MTSLSKILIVACFTMLYSLSNVYAQSPQITSGLTWLSANQNQNGSWPSASAGDFQSTAEVLSTLSLLGNKDASYNNALAWLSSQSIDATDSIARRIAAQGSSYTASDLSTMLTYQGVNVWGVKSGWRVYTDYSSEIIDTSLALFALKAASYPDTIVSGSAFSFLTSNQNPDGGWGLYPSTTSVLADESNVYTTAMALNALSLYKSTFISQTESTNAVNYLLSKQNLDGGFGSSQSKVYETALSMISLIESGQGQAQPLQNAINYITSNQLPDGSWNDDPYSTALALRALANVKPNLTVTTTDISFSNTMPQTGTAVTITANIRNTGLDSASNILVRFYLGDPSAGGTQIGTDQIISSLPVSSATQVSVSQIFTTTGSKTIFVQVDPTSQISEISKADNTASARLWVATAPDLAVFSEDLKPSTYVPTSGTAFTLEYTVRNLGESAVNGFDVAVYDGQPTGLPLQTVHISGIGGTEVRTGTFGVILTGDGAHTLYVVADSGNLIAESSKTNNTGTVAVNVGGTQTQADLSIAPMDITLTPARPHAGDTVQISANVHNIGADVANNFTVEIFDGAPETGGTLISSQVISMTAGGSQLVPANWAIPAGIHDVYVILDRANQVVETSETNNRASTRVMTDMVDIALSATDLTFNPSHPVSGDSVALTMTVHNQGIKNTGAFNLVLYNGDPSTGSGQVPNGGQGQAQPLQTFAIANIPGDGSAMLTYTFTASPQTYRFYAVADTENVVAEMYEENNTAIRSLKIKAPGEILGPDLVPIKIDLTNTTTDPQTLAVSGTAHVTLQNKGDAKISTPFNVIVFEDKDNDGKYTQGVDTLLGTGTNSLALWPEGANIADVPVSGTVRFLNAPLYAMVDSGDAILEQDETNNLLVSCKDCQVVPANPIQAKVQWKWGVYGYFNYTQPSIMYLRDTNSDGKIDQNDVPDILVPVGALSSWTGKLLAFKGNTGENYLTLQDLHHGPSRLTYPATGDIDGDGKPDIIFPRAVSYPDESGNYGHGIVAYNNDWTVKWDNVAQVTAWNAAHPPASVWNYLNIRDDGILAIADLDGDGKKEIMMGPNIINADGSVRCAKDYRVNSGEGSLTMALGAWQIFYSVSIADIDLDGKQEIIAGNAAYDSNCNLKWWNKALTDGVTAVANFDDDPYPEIVFIGYSPTEPGHILYLLDHNGNIKWGPVSIKQLVGSIYAFDVSLPIVADIDGDGKPEIVVRSTNKIFVFNKDGQLKNTLTIPHYNSDVSSSTYSGYSIAAPTLFDLDGDSIPEVLLNNNGYFMILSGKDGSVLFQDPFGDDHIIIQSVLVADIDGDGHVEVIVVDPDVKNNLTAAMRIYRSADPNHPWVNGRRIWNQPSYHVTNINDDGSIPQHEAPSWLTNNTYRTQAAIGRNPNPYLTPNLTASYMRATQNGASVDITVRIGNGGATASPSGVAITFYDGNPTTGAIIGTASTTKALQPGEYQDLIYSWTGSSIGLHHIYAVVDAVNAISECRKDDNQAQLDFTIQTGLPDLKVGAEDIIIPASPITEGSIVPINVTVHNIGSVTASNVAVKLANGIGGAWIGQPQTIGSVNAGGTATVTFNFDSLGHVGANVLYVSVDPDNTIAESTKANNAGSISINVQQPTLPNLAINTDGIQISPASPQEGNQIIITASITNRGSAVGNVPVRFSLGDPAAGGTTISMPVIYPMLSLGQSAQVQAVLDSTGWAGQQTVYVAIDPQNTISESSKGDNAASKALFIQSGGMTETVLLDKPSYQANDIVTATITAVNTTANSRPLLMNVSIKDSAGNLIATVSSGDAVAVSPNSSVTLTRTWNTGKTLSGVYKLTTEVTEGGQVISRANANFTVSPDKSIAATVTTDKVSYNPRESAAITSVITSQSANYIFSGLTASISIGNPVGGGQLYADTKTITTLIPGAAYTFKSYWNTGAFVPGAYPVSVQVKDASGAVIATGTQNLVIANVVNPSALLKGQLSVDKQRILSGDTVNIAYSVKNAGNIDLSSIGLSIQTVNVATQAVYGAIPAQTSLAIGQTYTGGGAVDTTAYTAKDYLVILRATINGTEATIAGTYFRVEGAPSAPSLASPVNGSDALTFMPTLSVNNAADPNDDRLTYQFELYSDSVLTDLVSSSELLPEAVMTAWTVPLLLAENQTYYWRARAFDGWLYGAWMAPASFRVNTVNAPPTAPTVSSPADGTTVSSFTPILAVNNANDPDSDNLTYNFDLALDPDFTRIAASTRGVSSGQGMTSLQVPITLQENTLYYWRSQADDWFIEGPWSTTSSFFVNTANDAPTAPVIIAPVNNSTVAALSTEIAVNNSADPDSTVISYFFEADTTMTFDSPNIIRSGSVTEGQQTTSWNASGLKDNTQYYVRAKASDGSADSPWSAVVGFFANTVNDPPTAPTLANPSNGAGVNVLMPTLSVHNSTDPDRDVLTYEFELYNDRALITLVTSATGLPETAQITSWTVPVSLTENAVYYWRVRAYDGALTSDWMPAASFMVNTANDAPSAPKLSSPTDGGSVATLTPTLAVVNAVDPDSAQLTYDFEVYYNGTLAASITGVPGDSSGITSFIPGTPLMDNTVYQWRARAFDGDRYGAWMPMATFSLHIASTKINATIDFDPDTLNKTSKGTWVVVYIELPVGFKPADIDISSIRLEGIIPAEIWPYAVGDHDGDGVPDLMVKFKRSDVINLLPNGDHVTVHLTGKVGPSSFEGIDIIRVIP